MTTLAPFVMTWPPQDREQIIDAVRTDVTVQLGRFFEPTSLVCGFDEAQSDPESVVLSSSAAVAVAWTFEGHHTGRFLGIEPTGVKVEIDGLTMMLGSEQSPQVRRYIDWHAVLAQLGSLPGRPLPQRPVGLFESG